MSSVASTGIDLPLPAWFSQSLAEPAVPASLATAEGATAIVEEIYTQTVQNHRMLEQFQGLDSKWVLDLIHLMCERAVAEFQKGKYVNVRMSQWLQLVSTVVDIESYGLESPIRLACESVILNLYCRFVKHPRWISSPEQLMRENNNFEKERSYWWRKHVAKPTPENTRDKLEKLIADAPSLLKYYNAVLHASDLMAPHPTLKHTVTLSSLTVEGRSYENGQGRSIASECRHVVVRKECVIPIKPRPPRSTGGGSSKMSAKSKNKLKDFGGVAVGIGAELSAKEASKKRKLNREDCSSTADVLPRSLLLRQTSAVDAIPRVPTIRMTSADWPSHLGLDDILPPSLTEEEQLMFSQLAEKDLMGAPAESSLAMLLMPKPMFSAHNLGQANSMPHSTSSSSLLRQPPVISSSVGAAAHSSGGGGHPSLP